MTNDIGNEHETGPPEALLDWIAAGRPDPVPAEVALWRTRHADADAQVDAIARVWTATQPESAPAGGLDDIRTRLRGEVRSARAGMPLRWPLQAAAAVVLLSMGAFAGSRVLVGAGSGDEVTRVVVPAGASVELQLPGDVAVKLNAGSSLSYAAGQHDVRDVTLEGEGFFRVPHDPDRTFIVRTPVGVIRDIGTAFGVTARDGAVTVIVTEGIVALEAAGGAVDVSAGYTSSAVQGQPPTTPTPAEPQVALAWTEGRMVFIDQTLGTIARDLSRRFGIEVEVAPSLVEQRVTASIGSPADLDNALRLITLAAGARYERVATGWRITAS